MEIYGYVRVSSKDQNPDRQEQSLIELGIKRKNIFVDKMSGKDFNRPAYKKMIRKIKEGDEIVIKSIDRLGRNYDEILKEWRIITKEKKVDIQVIDMPLLNTKSETSDLTGIFIADLVLQILAYVAETERAFIKQRQAEGIAIAKAKGIQFGRKRLPLPDAFEDYYHLWMKGNITIREGAEALGMSHSTFFRRCKEYESLYEM